jgi:hypothetical protein
MKSVLFYAALLTCVIVIGCNKKRSVSLVGVYKLDNQKITGGGTDSAYSRTQVKIYTHHNFIYAGMTPDSTVGFAVGTYRPDTGNTIIEHEFFSSFNLNASRTFHVMIRMKDSGYTQTIPDISIIKKVKYDLIEDYTRLPAGDTSKLDGLWKMDKAYLVKGKDTVKQQNTQYKIFWGGHFLYIHSLPDDKTATKFKSGFGFGTFTFKDNTITELDQISSDKGVLNRTFKVSTVFTGNDEYTQVINDASNNQQSVEIYKRVK